MEKKQYFQAQFKAIEKTEKGTIIRGYASTSEKDRHNDIVEPEAFRKTIGGDYAKNPIVLFQHMTSRPIGKIEKMTIDTKGLNIEAVIVDDQVEPKINAGILQTLSIGYVPTKAEFRDKDGVLLDMSKTQDQIRVWFEEGIERTIKELDLFEVSVVSIPANPGATFAPKLFSLAKSVSKYFELQKKEFLSNNDNDMTKKAIDLINKKAEDEEADDAEDVENSDENQDDASDEKPGSQDGGKSDEDEGAENDDAEGDDDDKDEADDDKGDDAADDDAGSDDDEDKDDAKDEDEDEEDEDSDDDDSDDSDDDAKGDEDKDDDKKEDEEKEIEIDPKLVTAENLLASRKEIVDLKASNKRLAARAKEAEAKLAETPVKKALSTIAAGIQGEKDSKNDKKPEDSKKGFKKGFFKG